MLPLPSEILHQQTAWLDPLRLSTPHSVCYLLLPPVGFVSLLVSVHHALCRRGSGARCYCQDRTVLQRGHLFQELSQFLPAGKDCISPHRAFIRGPIPKKYLHYPKHPWFLFAQ